MQNVHANVSFSREMNFQIGNGKYARKKFNFQTADWNFTFEENF